MCHPPRCLRPSVAVVVRRRTVPNIQVIMRRSFVLLTALAMSVAAAGSAEAQSGFALKGSLLFNSSEVEGTETDYEDSAGFNLGAEMVLPLGIGIGVSGYTAGSPEDFNFSEGSLIMLGEANYFIYIPALPLSPYIGAHVGLGTLDLGWNVADQTFQPIC